MLKMKLTGRRKSGRPLRRFMEAMKEDMQRLQLKSTVLCKCCDNASFISLFILSIYDLNQQNNVNLKWRTKSSICLQNTPKGVKTLTVRDSAG